MGKINQKEKEIIKWLRKGKRVNISGIARELNLPVSTVSDRIRKIEDKYIIKRASLLDYTKMGYFAHAKLAINIEQEKRTGFLDFLKKEECVNSIYHINSGFDFLVEIVFKNAIELKAWVEHIKKMFVFDILTLRILKIEQREEFMSK